MDSYIGEDPTLPGIASDGDSLLDAEICLGTGNLLSLPDGSIPVMPKSSTGRMSPIRAHTMKDFEQQLSDLKKENFNLKLRIYFLEERQERKWDADGEDLIKTNIQLNVEVESLKKDLMDKTELINQAASTMENLRVKQQSSSSSTRLEDSSRISELEAQLLAATDDAEKAKFALAETKSHLQELQVQMRNESMRRWAEGDADPVSSIASPKGDVKGRRGMECSPSPDSDKDSGAANLDAPHSGGTFLDETELNILEKKASLLDLLLPTTSSPTSSSSSAYLTQLEKDVNRVAEELRSVALNEDRLNNCKCGAAVGNIPRHTFEDLEELVESQEAETRKMEADISHLKAELETRQAALESVEEQLKSQTKAVEMESASTAASIEKLESELTEEKNAYEKGLKTIQGMTKILHQKEKEIEELQTSLDEAGEERRLLEGQMTAAAAKSQKDKDQDARDKSDRLMRAQELEEILRDKKLELERVQKSNERKDKELANLNIQLDAVEERLRAADAQVQDLRDELQSEKQRANDKADATQQHFQTLLDEAQRESTNKDRLINRLTRGLKDRDDSIGELLEASELSGSGVSTPNKQLEIINKLKERLRERDKAVEEALSEKASCLEEKEEDLRKLRRQLRDRERETENSNAVLLATEETIESLERDVKDRENANKKLAAELKDKDKLWRENSDLQSSSTKELESTIQRLQAALDTQNRLSLPATDAGDETMKTLRDALVEKDKFIQELLKERADAARQSDESAQKLVLALTDKDSDIKNLYEKEEKEKAELNRRILELTTDLNRRKFELEQAETRGQWSGEQQAETISQLRQALKEKDDVIQSLVESGRGKDVLLCASSPSIRDPEIEEKMKEMRVNKEKAEKENRKLKKQLQDKESEMKSQQALTDRLKKESTADKTKSDESQKKLHKEIQHLKETIEKIKGESTLDGNQNLQKLQEDLDALRLALEAAGIRSVTDPQKIGIEISHLIRRASLSNADANRDCNADSRDDGGYSLLRDAASAERQAYAAMASALESDGDGVNHQAVRKLREELEKITSLRQNLEEALGEMTKKATPKKMTPSKLKMQTKAMFLNCLPTKKNLFPPVHPFIADSRRSSRRQQKSQSSLSKTVRAWNASFLDRT